MGFEVVQGSPQLIWVPVDGTDTLYVGQIVHSKGAVYGAKPWGVAKGAADTTDTKVPFGIIVGVNDKDKTFDTTYKGNSITGVLTQALQNARNYTGVEGPNPKGDPLAYVQIAVITPSTIIRGPIFNAAYGTAPTEQTISVAQADGMITAETWSNADAASFTAGESTVYMRTGLNRGIYRMGNNTSRTAPDVTHAMPQDNTTSDLGLQVPIRAFGTAKIQFDDESTYVDVAVAYTTNYAVVEIVRLDLSRAGSEHVEFKFNADHFASIRA